VSAGSSRLTPAAGRPPPITAIAMLVEEASRSLRACFTAAAEIVSVPLVLVGLNSLKKRRSAASFLPVLVVPAA
jgi:hypothetical protein